MLVVLCCVLAAFCVVFCVRLTRDTPSIHNARICCRVGVDAKFDMVARLRQEFIRIRKGKEGDREAILLALLMRTFKTRVIVFIAKKTHAHRYAL